VDQPAFPTQPIFILTSGRTFSAAEAIAYNLQATRHAVVVGETSGGGANPSAGMDLGPWFTVVMPIATTVLSATGTNWEGVGVHPDVPAPASSAMEAVLALASAAANTQPSGD
jgi:C-terminal processing protease CtpA/Prc